MERIPWPKHGYTKGTWELALGDARRVRYDIALIASEEPAAYRFARRAGIPQRRGFHNGLQKPLKSFWVRRQLTDAIYRPAHQPRPRHEVEVMYDLGRSLVTSARPSKDAPLFRELLLEQPVRVTQMPAVQVTRKWLSPSRDEALVRAWFEELAAAGPWAGFCSTEERPLGERLGERAGLRMLYFESVKEWKTAIAAAPYVITPDTGAAHLAGMLCIECTDIFEAAGFSVHAARWSPWCGKHVVRAFPSDRNGLKTFARGLLEDWRGR